MEFDLTLFTPRQAEKITGISMVRQRDLRRSGYLRRHDGVAAFNVIDLAEMMVISAMMLRGSGPARSTGIAKISAIGITKYALAHARAWEGMEHANWSYPGEQDPEDKAAWLSGVFAITEAQKGDDTEIKSSNGLWRLNIARFLIIWADGREFWTPSVDDEISNLEADDARLSGPITVIDQHAMGAALLGKAGQPLARVFPKSS